MAEVRPILPLLYDPTVVGDVSSVITPPYDVISPEEQDRFRERSPYSAIHLELPVGDGALDPYRRAASVLRGWRAVGVVREHPRPAFFVHRQSFRVGDRSYERTALLAGVRLVDWSEGVVLPHERTLRGPKRDRLELLRATGVAPSPVFGLYDPLPEVSEVIGSASRAEPLLVACEGGVENRLWPVEGEEAQAAIERAFRSARIYMADGHHRYETALAYRDECLSKPGASRTASYNYVAMSLVAFDDPGLVVLPTHRLVVGADPEAVAALPEQLDGLFRVERPRTTGPSEAEVEGLLETDAPYAFVVHDGAELLRLTGDEVLRSLLPADRSDAWKALDLAVLHELVIGRALGIAPERTEEHVRYTRDVPGALDAVRSGRAQVACFVRPTSVGQLRAVADAGDKMPQKSTYFYPKFPAGLVINQLQVELPGPGGDV